MLISHKISEIIESKKCNIDRILLVRDIPKRLTKIFEIIYLNFAIFLQKHNKSDNFNLYEIWYSYRRKWRESINSVEIGKKNILVIN